MATVVTNDRIQAVKNVFNNCVATHNEHRCLVLLFNDDFFWE